MQMATHSHTHCPICKLDLREGLWTSFNIIESRYGCYCGAEIIENSNKALTIYSFSTEKGGYYLTEIINLERLELIFVSSKTESPYALISELPYADLPPWRHPEEFQKMCLLYIERWKKLQVFA